MSERLVGCFRAVFPQLPEDEVRRASRSSLPEWDSLATVNLMAVLEEEFDVRIGGDDVLELASFDLVAAWLAEKVHG